MNNELKYCRFLYIRIVCLPQKGKDSGKNSEHEGNELETVSEERSENQKSEKESENAGDLKSISFTILENKLVHSVA